MNDPVFDQISLTGVCASLCAALGIDMPADFVPID